jgi:hypothetical protein
MGKLFCFHDLKSLAYFLLVAAFMRALSEETVKELFLSEAMACFRYEHA